MEPTSIEAPVQLGADTRLWPVVRRSHGGIDPFRFEIEVPAHLGCWPGHFPGWQVVPGALQLHWVLMLAAHSLGLAAGPVRIERAKFAAPIGPGQRLELSLEPRPRGRVAFRLHDVERLYSSGLFDFTGAGEVESAP